MDKKLRRGLLKSGGKKALAEHNRLRRVPPSKMNLGIRIHDDTKHKKQKYREDFDNE